MTNKRYAEKIAEITGLPYFETKDEKNKLYGVVIASGEKTTTVITTNGMHDEKIPVKEAAEIVKKKMSESILTVDLITSYETSKTHLQARLYNEKTDADIFMKADKYGFDDLIIVPYIKLKDNCYTRVTKKLAEAWGMDNEEGHEEIIRQAMNNCKPGDYVLLDLCDFIRLKHGIEFPAAEVPLKIVTTADICYGAFGIIPLKKAIERAFPNGYYVIPSSIHEFLIIPTDMEETFVNAMVNQVNKEQVAPEERLGTHVYKFV
jgi:hypothetical protein